MHVSVVTMPTYSYKRCSMFLVYCVWSVNLLVVYLRTGGGKYFSPRQSLVTLAVGSAYQAGTKADVSLCSTKIDYGTYWRKVVSYTVIRYSPIR